MSEEHGGGGGEGGGNVIANLLAKIGISVDNSGLEGLHHNLERVKHAVELMAGIELLKGITELGERYAGLGESLESAAIQTGLTTDNLQKLQYAAAQNAISAEDMTMGLTRLSRQMYQAQKGSTAAQATFASLGISPEQLAGFADVGEAFYAVQDGINGLTNQQQKVATTMQLFGRGGAKYLKLMSQGSDATKQLGERAEQVGAIVSEKSIEALASFEDSMSSFRLVLRNFVANFAGAFIGPITRGLRALEEYFGKNKKYIVDGIAYIADRFGFWTYVAMGYVRVFGELIRRSLYGGDGLGGVVHKFLLFLKKNVSETVKSVVGAVTRAAENGSIQQLIDSLSSFFSHAKEAGASAVDVVSEFFSILAGGMDTSGLDTSTKALIIFLTTLQTIVDVMDLAFKSFIYFAKGQFGSDLYELVSGMASDISESQNRLQRGNNAVLGLAGAGVAQGMQSVSMMSAAAPRYATRAGAAAAAAAASNSSPVSMTAQVTINAGAISDPQTLAEMTRKTVSDEFAKFLNESRRDLSHPVLW